MADEIERITALGWVNHAHSYAASALALSQNLPRATHPDSVVRHLYRHAIEIYLKSFLLERGIAPERLWREFGHDTEALADEARSLGLDLSEEQRNEIAFIKNALPDRYLEIGARRILDEPAMLALCRHLHGQIAPRIYAREGLRRAPAQL